MHQTKYSFSYHSLLDLEARMPRRKRVTEKSLDPQSTAISAQETATTQQPINQSISKTTTQKAKQGCQQTNTEDPQFSTCTQDTVTTRQSANFTTKANFTPKTQSLLKTKKDSVIQQKRAEQRCQTNPYERPRYSTPSRKGIYKINDQKEL